MTDIIYSKCFINCNNHYIEQKRIKTIFINYYESLYYKIKFSLCNSLLSNIIIANIFPTHFPKNKKMSHINQFHDLDSSSLYTWNKIKELGYHPVYSNYLFDKIISKRNKIDVIILSIL